LNFNHCSRCNLLQCETKTAISKFATRFEECDLLVTENSRNAGTFAREPKLSVS